MTGLNPRSSTDGTNMRIHRRKNLYSVYLVNLTLKFQNPYKGSCDLFNPNIDAKPKRFH